MSSTLASVHCNFITKKACLSLADQAKKQEGIAEEYRKYNPPTDLKHRQWTDSSQDKLVCQQFLDNDEKDIRDKISDNQVKDHTWTILSRDELLKLKSTQKLQEPERLKSLAEDKACSEGLKTDCSPEVTKLYPDSGKDYLNSVDEVKDHTWTIISREELIKLRRSQGLYQQAKHNNIYSVAVREDVCDIKTSPKEKHLKSDPGVSHCRRQYSLGANKEICKNLDLESDSQDFDNQNQGTTTESRGNKNSFFGRFGASFGGSKVGQTAADKRKSLQRSSCKSNLTDPQDSSVGLLKTVFLNSEQHTRSKFLTNNAKDNNQSSCLKSQVDGIINRYQSRHSFDSGKQDKSLFHEGDRNTCLSQLQAKSYISDTSVSTRLKASPSAELVDTTFIKNWTSSLVAADIMVDEDTVGDVVYCLCLTLVAIYTIGNFLALSVLIGLSATMRELLKIRSGSFTNIYFIIGFLLVAKSLYQVLAFLWCMVVPNNRKLRNLGQWAVITGCTNGIGKEFARQIAAKGINVCLISRDPSLLQAMERDIANEFGVRTMSITIDFDTGDDSIYEHISFQLRHFDIGILVNNVGTSTSRLQPFLEHLDDKMVTRIINVNIKSVSKMTEIILPGMLTRKSGLIINMSSGFGRQPTPMLSLYGATKSFVDQFSQALHEECRHYGVSVQSLTPYFVSTNMTYNVPPSLMIPATDKYVRSALSTAGRLSRTHGYWAHAVKGFLYTNLPQFLQTLVRRHFANVNKKLEQRKLRQNGSANGKDNGPVSLTDKL